MTSFWLPAFQNLLLRTSLVVQWLRLCLPMQGTRVQSLIRELGSHMPMGQLTCALQLLSSRALEPMGHNWREACVPQGKIMCAATKTQCSQK